MYAGVNRHNIVLVSALLTVVLSFGGCGKPAADDDAVIVPAKEYTVDCKFGNDTLRTQTSLAIDPKDSNIVYVGVQNEGGVFKTSNGGDSWKRIDSGINYYKKTDGGYCLNEVYSKTIDPSNSSRVCLALEGGTGTHDLDLSKYGGVYCSENGGDSWKQLIDAKMNAAVYSVAIVPGDSSIMFAGVLGGSLPGSTVVYHTVGVVYKTTDGGVSWKEVPTGFFNGLRASRVMIHPTDPKIVYASTMVIDPISRKASTTEAGLLKSIDGGSTWQAANTGLANYEDQHLVWMDVSERDPNHIIVAGAGLVNHTLWISSNGGGSFTAVTAISGKIMAFDSNDFTGSTIYALGSNRFENTGYLMKTIDFGANWTKAGLLPDDIWSKSLELSSIRVSRSSSNVIYISASKAAVYKSLDGGATWKKILSDTDLPAKF